MLIDRDQLTAEAARIELQALEISWLLCEREGITQPDDVRAVHECVWRILRGRAGLPKDITQAKAEYLHEIRDQPDDEAWIEYIEQRRS